jgi:hypothetical protein
MSGGHYDYKYMQLELLADDIERDFLKDGRYIGKDWETGAPIEMDLLSDVTPEQRKVIISEITSIITDLRKCSKRAKELKWYLSGDTGASTYLERLSKIK